MRRRVPRAILATAAGLAATAGLALAAPGAVPRVPTGTKVLKGAMEPKGSIRFQAIPTKEGARPKLDRFLVRFKCLNGVQSGMSYGAAPGASIRPNAKRKFRIGDEAFALTGKFNRRYTKATGTFRFVADLVTSEGDFHCVTGKLTWSAAAQE